MVEVLYGRERATRSATFSQLFRLRYDVFITRRQWSLPSRDLLEIDQYDTEDAVYFCDFAGDGSVSAHVRLTPTMRSSLIADYFPHLCETGAPLRSPTIYEATRYMIAPATRGRDEQRKAASRLLVTAIQWSMARELTHLQTVIDFAALRTFVEMTILTTPMGLSHPFGGGKSVPGGGECLAFRWPVTAALLDDIEEYGREARIETMAPTGVPGDMHAH